MDLAPSSRRLLPGEFTRGRRELLAVLTLTKVEYVAARCRVTPSAVYQWTSGRNRPRPATRRVLERSYQIAASAWELPARWG